MAENTKNKEIIIKVYNQKLLEVKHNFEKYKTLEKQMNKLQEISSATSAKALAKENKEQNIWNENDPVYKVLTAIVKERATKGIINMDDVEKLKTIQNTKMMDIATKINNNVEIINEIHDFIKDDLGIPKDSTVIEWEEKGVKTPRREMGKNNLMLDIGKNMWEVTKMIDGGITTKDREVLSQKLHESNIDLEVERPRQGINISDDSKEKNDNKELSNNQM